ncbi:hypothetical protein Bealeia1_00512 [Candidatus Bealeia paramacronuclearis]|uniref:GNAT family N-acetyltransferase n=1 Tax=Candidatus Bealeia paramacronuclearis TaxID=1921001 RepID=A0ABZ2C1F0_9PROT|nr:hypothetical protein [Candidatus Bealeia paramacronuclearis]
MRKVLVISLVAILSPSFLKADPPKIVREKDQLTVSWKSPSNFLFQTVSEKEKEAALNLILNAPFKEGLPDTEETKLNNWWKNQHESRISGATTNAHHLYSVKNKEDKVIGVIHLGRMPVFGAAPSFPYDPLKHSEILDHWISMGVAKKKDTNGSFEYTNLERVKNSGIATILPVFAEGVLDESKVETLKAAFEFAHELSKSDELLPRERKVDAPDWEQAKATWAFNLVDPKDPILPFYEKSGFSVVKGEWISKFYDKDRVIVEVKL